MPQLPAIGARDGAGVERRSGGSHSTVGAGAVSSRIRPAPMRSPWRVVVVAPLMPCTPAPAHAPAHAPARRTARAASPRPPGRRTPARSSKRAAVLRNGMTGKRVSAAQASVRAHAPKNTLKACTASCAAASPATVPCAACAVSSWLPNGPSMCSTTALKTATPIAPPTARKRCARRWRCRYRPPAPSSAMPPSWAAGSRRCPRPAGRKGQRRQPGQACPPPPQAPGTRPSPRPGPPAATACTCR